MFIKYQHVERFGTDEVENIELGICHVFPKIDGTNGSVWLEDGQIKTGSRNRELSLESDNAGFDAAIQADRRILSYLSRHPEHRIMGMAYRIRSNLQDDMAQVLRFRRVCRFRGWYQYHPMRYTSRCWKSSTSLHSLLAGFEWFL